MFYLPLVPCTSTTLRASIGFPMFAGIFTIGLFFAVLFLRAGNLWMVGIFHGLGDSYVVGLNTNA